MNTCDACKHYTPSQSQAEWAKNNGSCAVADEAISGPNRFYASDYDECGSVYVGPKFGCIHWEKKS